MINKAKQKGAETAEFAIIAVFLFSVLFAITEFSRALYFWNSLAEATRRGARMAVVCPYKSDIPKQVAIFGTYSSSYTTSPVIVGLTPAMVDVRYYNQAGAEVADPTLIKFVQVKIINYTFNLNIPLFGNSILAPAFTTTLTIESLGAVPTYPTGASPATPDCNF